MPPQMVKERHLATGLLFVVMSGNPLARLRRLREPCSRGCPICVDPPLGAAMLLSRSTPFATLRKGRRDSRAGKTLIIASTRGGFCRRGTGTSLHSQVLHCDDRELLRVTVTAS